ncbi:hypothetical protein Dxin01_03509 [Deinococcus xinjiangensis]|uniref:GmrSD restriction endonucleases N-terminal domain-containing protein n=1 Tax=Deinococcus xinjiangensis TaxID=457454 RepID=A0ABP9VEU9_9DEIO
MAHENSSSESLQTLVAQLDAQPPVLLLPEFQRDFVWEVGQTYTLFDSLVQDIFIGSIIFGKPSFELTLRKIDTRPRKGKGSKIKLERLHYSESQIKAASQIDGLKIVLDGQQRLTSIYRALKGIDRVYFVGRPDLPSMEIRGLQLEDLMHRDIGIQGEDVEGCVCIPLHYAFEYAKDTPFDDDVRDYFRTQTKYGRTLVAAGDEEAEKAAFRAFRQLLPRFKTLFEEPRLLSYYLLDMQLDKFTTFFERSNSRGITLNFTDVLAAKVFGKFNLRASFDELTERYPNLPVKRELLVRALAMMCGLPRIEKAAILRELRAEDFLKHWDDLARLYIKALTFLHAQRYIVSIKWLPSENMMIPLMMFFHALEQTGKASLTQKQQDFLRWWYWSATFAEQFSAASNERIITDTRVLQRVARGESIEGSYFVRLRPTLDDPEQLFTYRTATSVTYKGVLNLVHFAANGLRDWSNNGPLATELLRNADLHDHHLFPQGFLRRSAAKQDQPDDVEMLKDCVLNRVLMPKDANLKASDKPPYKYLGHLLNINPALRESMASHLVPVSLLDDEQASYQVYAVLWERAEGIIRLIRRETVEAEAQIRAQHAPERLATASD